MGYMLDRLSEYILYLIAYIFFIVGAGISIGLVVKVAFWVLNI